MFKIDKYLILKKLPKLMVVRHKGCSSGDGKLNKCSRDCPQDQPKAIDCTAYECIRHKKIRLVEPPKESPIHPFLKPDSHNSANMWRNIFFLVCVPTIIAYYFHAIVEETEFRRPKYVEFAYLRIRNKEYPWDPVKTLFHNPRANALPGGYEVEVPEEQEYDPFSVLK